MWDTSSPTQAGMLHYATGDEQWVVRARAWITGFPAVEEGQFLSQHSLKHQLLDAAVNAAGCDVVHEVAQQLSHSAETQTGGFRRAGDAPNDNTTMLLICWTDWCRPELHLITVSVQVALRLLCQKVGFFLVYFAFLDLFLVHLVIFSS